MKHIAIVSFLAGCPDDPPPPAPSCVHYESEFSTRPFGDENFLTSSPGVHGTKVKPVALGGVEYVGAYVNAPYNTEIHGSAIAIDTTHLTATSAVPILGASEGSAELCVGDHGEETLPYGVTIDVAPVAAMTVLPANDLYEPYEVPAGTQYPYDWRLFAGARRTITAGLHAADDTRLVDQGMAIDFSVDGETFAPGLAQPWEWDSASRDVDHATTLAVRATLSSGEEWHASVGVVDHVDQIAMTVSGGSWAAGGWASLCFTAKTDGAIVLGAPYAYSASSVNVALAPDDHPSPCIGVAPLEYGPGTLTVSVGTTHLDVPYMVY